MFVRIAVGGLGSYLVGDTVQNDGPTEKGTNTFPMPETFQGMNRGKKSIGNIAGMTGNRLMHFQIPDKTASIGHKRAMSCNLIGDINRTTDPVFAVDTILKLHVKGILGHLQRGQGIICLKLEPTISRLREYTGFYGFLGRGTNGLEGMPPAHVATFCIGTPQHICISFQIR